MRKFEVYLEIVLPIRKLRSFYAIFGTEKWLSPIVELQKCMELLKKHSQKEDYMEIIIRSIVNAGKLGFCPMQYLRRTIYPLLESNLDSFKKFKKHTSLIENFFIDISSLLHERSAGDGSANNIFTLKTLIRPLANPNSNLYNQNYFDEDNLNPEDILRSIADAWSKLIARYKNSPYFRILVRFYMDIYIEGIVKIETPKEIENQILTGINHLNVLSKRINGHIDFKRFTKPLHTKGIQHYIDKVNYHGGHGNFLRLMRTHFNINENVPFDSIYRHYLIMFARGYFESPEDINNYFDFAKYLHSQDGPLQDMMNVIILEIKSEESKKILLDFLNNCTIYDEELYFAWKKLSPNDR